MAPLSNAQRQARFRQRQAYERDVMKQQIEMLANSLNEARGKLGLPEIQLPKMAAESE